MWFRCAVGEPAHWPVLATRSCTDLANFEDPVPSHSHDALKVPVIQGNFEENNVLVWRLPVNISQSRLAGRKRSSNACTIISLKVVEYLYENNVLFPNIELEDANQPYFFRKMFLRKSFITTEFPCPGRITNCMANAILEGNEIHERVILSRTTQRKNFTIPEALDAVGNSFREMDFCSIRGPLCENLPSFIMSAINCKILSSEKCLYFLLIVVEQCVVIVYQRVDNLIGFLDSHLHSPDGAIVACTTLDNLDSFCLWLKNCVFVGLNSLDPSLQSFELSSIFRVEEDVLGADSLELNSHLPVVVRRHSVFPVPKPWQLVTKEVRERARQALLELRQNWSLIRHQERQQRRLRRGAKCSTSLPVLL